MMRLSALHRAILATLTGKELYGLVLKETLEQDLARSLNPGSVYFALRTLEAHGLVAARREEWREGERLHSRRRYYTTTPEGRAALGASRKE